MTRCMYSRTYSLKSVLVGTLVLFMCITSANADDDEAPAWEAMIEKGAEIADGDYFLSSIRLAAEMYPDDRSDIAAFATDLKPDQAAEIEALMAEIAEVSPLPVEPTGFFGWDGWSGQGELGGGFTSGNTDESTVGIRFRLEREAVLWTHEFDLLFDFTETDGQTTKQRLDTTYKLNRSLTERLYAFGLVNYEDDRFSGFDYRLFFAPGLGYRVFDRDDLSWRLEAGPGVRLNKFNDGTSDTEVVGFTRSRFSWQATDTLELINDTDVIGGGTSVTLKNLAAALFKINDRLRAKFSVDVRTESDPPPPAKRTDTTTKASIVYDF